MAKYVTSVRTQMSPESAFAYMADLRNFDEWDPGVSSVTQIDGDGAGQTASFDVSVKGIGPDMVLRYVTDEYEPPFRVLVTARSAVFTSIDVITVETDDQGTVVTYNAELRLNGVLALGDPFLRLVFGRIGDRAAGGLRKALRGTG
jgi:carbon monoxide dehydrogenase subunit G